MTMKPFEIQGQTLSIGGVELNSSSDGKVVIPGVTRATGYRVEEVQDTGDQTRTFSPGAVAIDYVTFNGLLNQADVTMFADYEVNLEDDGKIDEIKVNGQGTYTAQQAADNEANDMYVYVGAGNASDRPLVAQDWVTVPFRPSMRSTGIESEFGSGSGTNLPDDEQGYLQNDGDGNLTWSSTTADLGDMRLASWNYPGDNPLRITHATRGESVLLQTSDDSDSGKEGRTSIRWHIRNEPDGQEGSRYSQVDVQNDGVWIKNADWSGSGGSHYWHFDGNGNLTLPQSGDIKDSNGNSVLGGAGGSDLAPYLTINEDNNVQITSDIVFSVEQAATAGYVFTITDPNHNDDAYFQAATADSDGVMYTVGTYRGGNSYGMVFATNTDGTVKWETTIDQFNGSYSRLNSIFYRNGYVFVGVKYYTGSSWDSGIVRLNANDGSYSNQWMLSTPDNNYSQIYDLAVDNNNEPIAVGRVDGEMRTVTGVVAQSGSGLNKLVVNTSDILTDGSTNVEQIQWYIDDTGSGNYVSPSAINTFYDLPTVSVDGSGTGLTINIRYSGGKVTYAWMANPGSGYSNLGRGNYTFGEQIKILGSSYGAVDGDNDLIFYIWTYGNGDVWTIVAPNQDWSQSGNTPTALTYFDMGDGVDFSQGSPWNFRYPLSGQAFIWTPNWQHTYGNGSQWEQFRAVAQDNNTGDIYAGGNFQLYNPVRNNVVYKLDSSGNTTWVKYIEDSDSLGGSFGSLSLDSTGASLFVSSRTNNDYALVTKLATDIGSITWSVRQTNRDSNNYWNNTPRSAVDANGDVYLTGSWTWNDSQYGLSIAKLNGSDGSLAWATKLNTTDNQSLYEYYDEDTQPFKLVNGKIYYAGYTYDSDGNRNIGYAVVLPADGTGTGTYGRWLYETDTTFGFTGANVILGEEGTFTATDGISVSVNGDVSVNLLTNEYDNLQMAAVTFTPPAGGVIDQVGSITFADGTTQTTAATAGAQTINWNNPNGNTWRIEEYNGGASVTYNGNDYDAKWFDVADAPSGNNQFRGAIIQYHAYTNNAGGTIIGTIHLGNDYSQQEATHTEHMSGNSNLGSVTLWACNNERGQLYFKRTDGSQADLLIQWTAKIFYGSENYC